MESIYQQIKRVVDDAEKNNFADGYLEVCDLVHYIDTDVIEFRMRGGAAKKGFTMHPLDEYIVIADHNDVLGYKFSKTNVVKQGIVELYLLNLSTNKFEPFTRNIIATKKNDRDATIHYIQPHGEYVSHHLFYDYVDEFAIVCESAYDVEEMRASKDFSGGRKR